MSRKKKKIITTIAGILILILGAAATACIFIYTYNRQEPQQFVAIRKNLATKLYNEVTQYDFENDYPETPAEVIELNNKINLLIYGDMLLGDELLEELLLLQRNLYADILLDSITFEEQYKNLINGLEKYKEYGTICYDISYEGAFPLPDDEEITVVNVVWQTNNMGKLAWQYKLGEDENGRYKILEFMNIQ